MRKEMGYILGIISLTGATFMAANASALTYQSNVGVNFTFNTALNITLDSADLIIENLNPGTADDSNIITVNVKTNNKLGYDLTSTVGNTTYNDRNLTLKNGDKTFTSVDYGTTIADNSNLTDNTWAYSYSTDNGTNWVAGSAGNTVAGYSGLPLYTDETNITTLRSNPGPTSDDGDDTKFKIAARASGTQSSGEYNNVINFNVVAEPEPMTLAMSYAAAGKNQFNGYYVMQEMTPEICANAEVVDNESQLQLIDTRDNKIYWATKLKDGHCWMTQNLDLDLDSAVTYTHANTDLGWGSDTATTTWTPDKSTIAWDGSTFSGWSNQNQQQYSVDTGDYYYIGLSNSDEALPNAGTNYLVIAPDANGDIINSSDGKAYFSTDPSRVNGGTHQHVGNYYNWSAAVASNDTSSYSTSTYADISGNPQNSICPAGWRLPTISSASNTTEGSTNEFGRINKLYNNDLTNNAKGLGAPPLYYNLPGFVYNNGLQLSGSNACYLGSTVNNGSSAYVIDYHAYLVRPQYAGNRYLARSVRCLAR